MVMGLKNGRTFHVGYLPTGEYSTLALRELTLITAPRRKFPAVNGIVRMDASGYVVDLRAPYSTTTRKLVTAAK